MAEEPPNLVLELLRAMRGDMSELRAEMRKQRSRLAAIDSSVAYVEREIAEQ